MSKAMQQELKIRVTRADCDNCGSRDDGNYELVGFWTRASMILCADCRRIAIEHLQLSLMHLNTA